MEYNISKDVNIIRILLDLSQEELANIIGVEKISISRLETGKSDLSERKIKELYNFIYSKKIYLNKLKSAMYKEMLNNNEILLFHGSKTMIKGSISLNYSKSNNDFGRGFYCGETYEQALNFVSDFNNSSIYLFKFNKTDLKSRTYFLNREWLMLVAYFRGVLKNFNNYSILQELLSEIKELDYIVAPIADNRMFEIIDLFIDGIITDEQCVHCLASSNLGQQIVILSDKAISRLDFLERFFISENERKEVFINKQKDKKINHDKVKLAMIEYKNQGKYIEEIVK